MKGHGGARKGAGRKLAGDAPMSRTSVTLDAATFDTCREVGDGNLSEGIRKLAFDERVRAARRTKK